MGDRFSCILPEEEGFGSLYLGTLDYMVQDAVLDELGIQSIVTCLPYSPDGVDAVLLRHEIDSGLDYLLHPLEDCSEHYIKLFEGRGISYTVDHIHSRRAIGKCVLVHCDAGRNRSPAVVVAYLMKYGISAIQPPLPLQMASDYVSSCRQGVNISLFRQDLEQWERQLLTSLSENSKRLFSSYVIVSTPGVITEDDANSVYSPYSASSPEAYPYLHGSVQGIATMSIRLPPIENRTQSICIRHDLLKRKWLNAQQQLGVDTMAKSFYGYLVQESPSLLPLVEIMPRHTVMGLDLVALSPDEREDAIHMAAHAHAKLLLTDDHYLIYRNAALAFLKHHFSNDWDSDSHQWTLALDLLINRMKCATKEDVLHLSRNATSSLILKKEINNKMKCGCCNVS